MEGKDFIENDVFIYREDDSVDEDDVHFTDVREALIKTDKDYLEA